MKLHNEHVTKEEKAFGVVKKNPSIGVIFRNWLTYLMRNCIAQAERKAYRTPTLVTQQNVKLKFNSTLDFEFHLKALKYIKEGKTNLFDEIVAKTGTLCRKVRDGVYKIEKVF